MNIDTLKYMRKRAGIHTQLNENLNPDKLKAEANILNVYANLIIEIKSVLTDERNPNRIYPGMPNRNLNNKDKSKLKKIILKKNEELNVFLNELQFNDEEIDKNEEF